MTEKEKMLAGQLYDPADEELIALREKAHALSKQYNDTLETQEEEREAIMKELVPDMGEDAYLQGPIQFDYGCFTRIGENTYVNFNFTCLDCAPRLHGPERFDSDACASDALAGSEPLCPGGRRQDGSGVCKAHHHRG